MLSDERLAANRTDREVRDVLSHSAVEAAARIHIDLHVERWERDSHGTAQRPPNNEMCPGIVGCEQLKQAVNKVKHALTRL